MSGRYTGGPAFPTPEKVRGGFGAPSVTVHKPGMTLRDWFAGQALTEAIRYTMLADDEWDPDNAAVAAYEIADAMLRWRDREAAR